MTKPSRGAVEQKPLIPPRRRSLIYMRNPSKIEAFNFPDSHQLIITTSSGVFVWSRDGVLPVFESKTGGIVAARAIGQGRRELLAVADSQVVLLHDMRKGYDKSYELKGSDVRLGRLARSDM